MGKGAKQVACVAGPQSEQKMPESCFLAILDLFSAVALWRHSTCSAKGVTAFHTGHSHHGSDSTWKDE
jgi:hypothetical protein